MIIKVATDGAVSLQEPDNFRAFKILVEGGQSRADQVRRALANTAELIDNTHAWVFEQALRQRPEVAQNAAWQASLGTMIEKARPHGWIDDQRKAIKAHIEWTTA
jgi:predicted transcriptional regulator